MSSVTQRINQIKQPYGGYLKVSQFEIIKLQDNRILNINENIHSSIIGIVVDYMSRYLIKLDIDDAFKISVLGAKLADRYLNQQGKLFNQAINLLNNIHGLDDISIINACKLVTFDVWYRNLISALKAKTFKEINPDKGTINNIVVMIERSIDFFDKYGPVIKEGFDFEPDGYTQVVDAGDGDFLTKDTLWDFKVSKNRPTNKSTLQLLMYWIMGQHSGQKIYKNINQLGIYNPRLNIIYKIKLAEISEDIIKEVENNVICY